MMGSRGWGSGMMTYGGICSYQDKLRLVLILRYTWHSVIVELFSEIWDIQFLRLYILGPVNTLLADPGDCDPGPGENYVHIYFACLFNFR